jgi:hypothetical protein
MFYLIEQLVWFLLVAFVLGLLVGWITSTPRSANR